MNRVETGDLKEDALVAFLRVADILDRHLELELSNYPVSRTEYILMIALKMQGGFMRPTDLSNHIFRAKHTISGLINSLEKKKFIKRELDKNDRRSFKISLTASGGELVDQIWRVRRSIAYKAMSCLDKTEITRMNENLNTLRERLLKPVDNKRKRRWVK